MKIISLIAPAVTAGAILFISVALSPTSYANTLDEKCSDVDIIFARGSGQSLKGTEGRKFESKIKERLADTSIDTLTYELGSDDYPTNGFKYPADAVISPISTGIGAFMSAGNGFKYGNSVSIGVAELKIYLNDKYAECGDNTYYILGGYSQGAQVIGQTLPSLKEEIRSQIAFVALFGDPKLYLPEGEGVYPDACRNKNPSPWRRIIGDCHTDNGLLGARKPSYIPDDMKNKAGLWCTVRDVVCGTSKTDLSGHLTYATNGHIDAAAAEIAAKLKAAWKDDPIEPEVADSIDTSMPEPDNPPLELAFVLNTSYSMRAYVEEAHKDELVNMGRSYLTSLKNAGLSGRIALVEYRDADSAYPARVLSDLTDDASEFERAVRDKLDYERTPSDEPEGSLHGYMTAMKELSWSAPGESEKGILLNSRSGFHEPDRTDGATQLDVIQETYKLGGVYLMAATANEHEDQYRNLARATDGIVIELREFTPADDATQLINKDSAAVTMRSAQATPGKVVAALSSGNYKARPGDTIRFDASGSYVNNSSIVRYEWDVNGDGYVDHVSSEPVFEYAYSTPFKGMMRVQVYDTYNRKASAYAGVEISNKTAQPTPTTPSALKARIVQTVDGLSTVELTWNPADTQTERWILTMNNDAMGYMSRDRQSVTITDVERAENVVFGLVGQNSDEVRGAFTEVTLPLLTSTSTEPENATYPIEPATPTQPPTTCSQTQIILRMTCEIQAYTKQVINNALWPLKSLLGTR